MLEIKYEEIILVLSAISLGATMLATYLAWRRTDYSKRNIEGSEKYWASWKERSKDVAESVLKEITTEDLEKELKKRYAKAKKKKKSRRIRKGNSGVKETVTGKTSSNQSNGRVA